MNRLSTASEHGTHASSLSDLPAVMVQLLSLGLALACLAGSLLSLRAMPLRIDTERVPIGRLLTNLEQQVQSHPQDLQARYALGRVHSLAYAMESDTFEIRKDDGTPFFGYFGQAGLPPREVRKPPSPEREKAAREHLQKAIVDYEKAVALDHNHWASQIGLAWCQDQAGQTQAALNSYRRALDMAWSREKNLSSLFDFSMTDEVVNYMLPLLDAKKDAEEIKKLEGYRKILAKKGRAVTPILIPLEPGGKLESLVDPHAGVNFDLDGSGVARHWGWITPKAGWLVYDQSGHDPITSGLQLVGGVTFWIFWENGYQALSALDNDGDGWLRGDELTGLAIWQDVNKNGRSDPGEVRPLKDWGIIALSCHCQPHSSGIPFSAEGVVFKDGTTRPSFDWVVPGAPRASQTVGELRQL